MSEHQPTIEEVFNQFETKLRQILEPANATTNKTVLSIHEHLNSQTLDLSNKTRAETFAKEFAAKFGKELADKLAPILAPIVDLMAHNPTAREQLQRILLPRMNTWGMFELKRVIAPPHVS